MIFLSLGVILMMGVSTQTWADENVDQTHASEKAQEAHDLSASNNIYAQEDFRALYYQNIEVIQLLKEIRDSLEVIKTESIKDMENSTENSQNSENA